MASVSSDSKTRLCVIEIVSRKVGLGVPLIESDFSPQDRKKVYAVAQMLEKRDYSLSRAFREGNEQFRYESERLQMDIDRSINELADSVKRYAFASQRIDFQAIFDTLKNKGIVLEKLECPSCGGFLKIEDVPKKEQVLQCRYCGSSILAVNLYEKFKEILRL